MINKLLFDMEATQPNSAGKRHGGGKYGEIVLTENNTYEMEKSFKWPPKAFYRCFENPNICLGEEG